jgi:hypothetical protein
MVFARTGRLRDVIAMLARATVGEED